jgi:hypothetical protein
MGPPEGVDGEGVPAARAGAIGERAAVEAAGRRVPRSHARARSCHHQRSPAAARRGPGVGVPREPRRRGGQSPRPPGAPAGGRGGRSRAARGAERNFPTRRRPDSAEAAGAAAREPGGSDQAAANLVVGSSMYPRALEGPLERLCARGGICCGGARRAGRPGCCSRLGGARRLGAAAGHALASGGGQRTNNTLSNDTPDLEPRTLGSNLCVCVTERSHGVRLEAAVARPTSV